MDMTQVNITPASQDGITKLVQLDASDLVQPKRHRSLNDLSSLIAYLKKWGDASKGTIYWTPTAVLALLDEEDLVTGRGKQDTIGFAFTRPLVARKWLEAIGRNFTHKEFKDWLELRWQEVANGSDLFTKVCNLQLAQTFKYEGKLDDDHNYRLGFTSEAGGDVALLPKVATVTIPLLDGLAKTYDLVLKFKLQLPEGDKPTPRFGFIWDDKEAVLEQAARDAVAELGAQLPAWLIVHGTP